MKRISQSNQKAVLVIEKSNISIAATLFLFVAAIQEEDRRQNYQNHQNLAYNVTFHR